MIRSCIHPQPRRADSPGQRGVRHAPADCGRPGRYVGAVLLLMFGLLLGRVTRNKNKPRMWTASPPKARKHPWRSRPP